MGKIEKLPIEEEMERLNAPGCASCAVIVDPHLPDMPVIFATRAFYDFTGYTPEEVLGRNCRFLQGPETDARAVKKIREAINASLPVTVDLLNYRRNGEPFLNRLSLRPMFIDGRIHRFLGYQQSHLLATNSLPFWRKFQVADFRGRILQANRTPRD